MKNSLTIQINDHLHYIGVNDRYTHLFENMWPLPEGISYNSYLLDGGTATCLLDCVKIPSVEIFLEKLNEVLQGRPLDYVVVNHMEPDHTSSLPTIIELFPEVKIIGNKRTVDFLKNFYDITENIQIVKENETVDIGNTSLTFYMTPMVHWPESMVAYESSTKTLFSQDAFGGFGTLDGAIFDDEVNFDFYKGETIRYYTNIVGKYSVQVQRALEKLSGLDIKMICPDHGPVWRTNPEKIVELYDELSRQETENGVVIIYGSMYGNTEKMAEIIARSLADEGIKNVRIRDISKTHFSYLIAETWRYRGVILGCPTYNVGMFPPMEALTRTLEKQKMKNHTLGIFGSYAWGGGALKALEEFAGKTGWEVLETKPEAKGMVKEEDQLACIQLGKEMAKSLKDTFKE